MVHEGPAPGGFGGSVGPGHGYAFRQRGDEDGAVHLLPNGGPADTTSCCICCGSTPKQYGNFHTLFAAEPTCFSGCCACTSVSSLSFEMHSCKTVTQPTCWWSPEIGVTEKDCTRKDGAFPMAFEMTRQVNECYTTQYFANDFGWNPLTYFPGTPFPPPPIDQWGATQQYRNDHNIHWSNPTTAGACQINIDYNPYVSFPLAKDYRSGPWPSGSEYTDPDKYNSTSYPEAWGYSGVVCEGVTTPNRPGYSYPGSCGGQSIIASLCCCKTGSTSTVRTISGDWATSVFGGTELQRKINTECPTKYPNISPDSDCTLGCFSFTIQPDHKYKHNFKVLKQHAVTATNSGDWELVDSDTLGESLYTSCSPCVYKQGSCNQTCLYYDQGPWSSHPNSTFNPSRVGNIQMDVGTMKSVTPQLWDGNRPATSRGNPGNGWNGQNTVISGQCNDGSTGSKKMRLVVVGAYLTHCDCQEGHYELCKTNYNQALDGSTWYCSEEPNEHYSRSACYGTKNRYPTEGNSGYLADGCGLEVGIVDDPHQLTPVPRWGRSMDGGPGIPLPSGLSGISFPRPGWQVSGSINGDPNEIPGPMYWSPPGPYTPGFAINETVIGDARFGMGTQLWQNILRPGHDEAEYYGYIGYDIWRPDSNPCITGSYFEPYGCGTIEERGLAGENKWPNGRIAGGMPWRLPAEIDPEDWDTSEGSPFGPNPWFHGGRDKNGTHPTANDRFDMTKWAWLYCREGTEGCGSLCEFVTPTIMWYTGILEET